MFRFAIMGAGKIAGKFCEAVELLSDCEVVAVSSKSLERAETFASAHKIRSYYDSYEAMLQEVKPDCVYIAVTQDAHFDLCMLCLDYHTPVLCEKAMFLNSIDAALVFDRAQEYGVFMMEAMWSRFLPANRLAKQWLEEGLIGTPIMSDFSIGFRAPADDINRYFNPALGGGAAYDITVYAYELTRYFIPQTIEQIQAQAIWSSTGVDVSNQVIIQFTHTLSFLQSSIVAALDEKMTIYGDKGKIIIPKSHFASEAMLYDDQNALIHHYKDAETKNGFVYEIQEVMDCVRGKELESRIVPHQLTKDCAALFDRILTTKSFY